MRSTARALLDPIKGLTEYDGIDPIVLYGSDAFLPRKNQARAWQLVSYRALISRRSFRIKVMFSLHRK